MKRERAAVIRAQASAEAQSKRTIGKARELLASFQRLYAKGTYEERLESPAGVGVLVVEEAARRGGRRSSPRQVWVTGHPNCDSAQCDSPYSQPRPICAVALSVYALRLNSVGDHVRHRCGNCDCDLLSS
jgi:hypothetical protein